MSRGPTKNTGAKVVGVSAGTGLSGLVLTLPDGPLRLVLMMLCPTLTLVASGLWRIATDEIDEIIKSKRIMRERVKAERFYYALQEDASANPELVQLAKERVEELIKMQIDAAVRNAEAILSS